LGIERKKLAAEGAFRANIAELMWELSQLSPATLVAAEPAPTPASAVVTASLPVPASPEPPKSEVLTEVKANTSPRIASPTFGKQPANATAPQIIAPPPVQPTPLPEVAVADTRADEMKMAYAALAHQARSGKLRYL
jgi:type IV secretory pathway VirB10-like protein